MTSIIVILISVFFMNMENNVAPPVYETANVEIVEIEADKSILETLGAQEELMLE